MLKTLTLSTFNRPEMFGACLDALSKCDGLESYKVICVVDGLVPEVVQIARQSDIISELYLNVDRLGCNGNLKRCMDIALDHGTDFNVHVEDDIVLSYDALKYFDFCSDYKPDDVYSISAYHHQKVDNGLDPNKIFKHKYFSPWGWATWKDRLKIMSDHIANPQESWDVHIHARLYQNNNLHQWSPEISRSQNIGYQGTHVTLDIWENEHFTPVWQQEQKTFEYKIV